MSLVSPAASTLCKPLNCLFGGSLSKGQHLHTRDLLTLLEIGLMGMLIPGENEAWRETVCKHSLNL